METLSPFMCLLHNNELSQSPAMLCHVTAGAPEPETECREAQARVP